ncbi:MAG: ATP-binding cassette domain-containing protein [Kiritimatiellae bacterium]|nr:ATP-binding cassette domain-containing protein [Kiritimatiellia bacterium]
MNKLDDLNRSIIKRYTNQPAELPFLLRNRIHDQPILMYGLADLNASLSLQDTWIILDPENLAVISEKNDEVHIERVKRTDIRDVTETVGLSCTVLRFYTESESRPLELRYSQRQRKTMEGIKLAVEGKLPNDPEEPHHADIFYRQSVASAMANAQLAVSGNKLAVIWRLLVYLKPYKRLLVMGSVAAIVLTIMNLLPPYLTGYIIDLVSQTQEVKASISVQKTVWSVIGLLAFVYIVREFCLWMRLRNMSMLGEYVAHDLRQELYNHLQTLSLRFFSRKQTGTIITRVSSDTDRLWDFIAFGIVEVSLSCIMLVGLGVVLVCLDWRLGLIMTVPIPLFLWAFYKHGKNIGRIFIKAFQRWSRLTALLSDTIPGIRIVKVFNQEQREIERFGKRNSNCRTSFNEVHRVWTSFWPRMMFAFHGLTLLVWMVALPRVMGLSDRTLTPGTFIAFLLYMAMFMHPLEVIGQMTRMLNRALSSAYRIFEILDTEPQIKNKPHPVQLKPVKGSIRYDNVSFSYDGVRKVLNQVSFSVSPGEMIGLVGPSGSGKTTLMNLLARFYDVTEGCLFVDGTDIRDVELGGYRKQIGMVLQDPSLFHGTIMDNISYGMQHSNPEQIIEAAKAANAHEFICRLEQGYETIVGERGHTLSGGERQRISIARAVLHNPRILILDEATSNVDTETEQKIQEALTRLIKGRTVLAIAHRLSTLKRATRLLVIKEGTIVEEGTHSELLKMEDGVFRKLYTMQQTLHEQFVA